MVITICCVGITAIFFKIIERGTRWAVYFGYNTLVAKGTGEQTDCAPRLNLPVFSNGWGWGGALYDYGNNLRPRSGPSVPQFYWLVSCCYVFIQNTFFFILEKFC